MYKIYNNRLGSVKCDMKRRKDTSVHCNGVNIMIRHILFWNYTDKVKSEHKEKETLKFLQDLLKLDIENPIIRINTAFKGCSSLEKISVLPRIYHN